jgi:asparagine synthase (glutamine-hydrolysing)
MCGICGVVRPGRHATEFDESAVHQMVGMLGHRGPDGSGSWNGGHVVFGHTRLSIIDLAGGGQPMFNETGEVAVTFNGEIYNFKDLSVELAAAGHTFRTHSDTEVVVHGYEQWGDDVVAHLRGMFAFALWDAPRKRLLLARDRLGEKPLYYHLTGSADLVFASEMKALLAHPDVPRELDRERLQEYLAFRSVSGPRTLFRDIRELSPASVLVADGNGLHEHRYWTPSTPIQAVDGRTAVERGRELLAEAVRLRLVSDVALGTITSGGLDSSLVSAIAVRESGRPLDTFCVGFDDPTYDERPFARQVSAHIGARYHEIVVSAADLDGELDALTWIHDEPLTHPNSIPMHLLFRYAKEEVGVTVLLSGEGADELFGGYDWYRVAARRRALKRWMAFRHLLPASGRAGVIRKVLEPDYLLGANSVSDAREVAALTAGAADVLGHRRELWPRDRSELDALFPYDQNAYLPPLLQRQDRMSMAASVEARVVFLDHKLVEWGNGLPAELKVPNGQRKALLKQIAEPWIPREIIDRPKVGFTLPLAQWLRPEGALGARVDRLRASSAFVRGLVDGKRLDTLLTQHATGAADHADILWTLVALETWAEVFLRTSPGMQADRWRSSARGCVTTHR